MAEGKKLLGAFQGKANGDIVEFVLKRLRPAIASDPTVEEAAADLAEDLENLELPEELVMMVKRLLRKNPELSDGERSPY